MSGASDLIDTEHGLKYWESIDADENGMLGGIPEVPGFQNISRIDLQGSRNFLAKLGIGSRKGLHKVENAMDGGAGYVGTLLDGISTSPEFSPKLFSTASAASREVFFST